MNIELNHIVDSDIRINMDRPELEGSEKQVDWADNIRAGFIRQAEAVATAAYNQPKKDGSKIADMGELYAMMESAGMIAAIKKVFSVESAKFWIDNRSCTFAQVASKA